MRKREFMDELKKALDGNVSTQTYYDTMNYYEDYFKKQKEAGKSEEEICSSLGSARLIAKTIIDTEGQGASGRYYDTESSSYDDSYNTRKASGSSQKGWHVNVDDGGAHAWIEAFIRGRWQVVELTPPSSEDEDETQDDFWSRFGRWLVGDDSGDTGTDTTGTAFSLGNAVWIIYVLAGCFI